MTSVNIVADPEKKSTTILCVDDDSDFRSEYKRWLNPYFSLLEAPNGYSGLEKYRKNRRQIKLLITDNIMPLKNGLDLLHTIYQNYPQTSLPSLLISANADRDLYLAIRSIPFFNGKVSVMAKDFDFQTELIPIIQEIMDHHDRHSSTLERYVQRKGWERKKIWG